MKFGIDMGHNCPPKDIGASGVKQEDDLTKAVGIKLMAKLSAAGHSVINCTPTSASTVNESLKKRVNKAILRTAEKLTFFEKEGKSLTRSFAFAL